MHLKLHNSEVKALCGSLMSPPMSKANLRPLHFFSFIFNSILKSIDSIALSHNLNCGLCPPESLWHHGAEEAAVFQLVPVLLLHHRPPHQVVPGLSGGGASLRKHHQRSHPSLPPQRQLRRSLLHRLQELRVAHHLGGRQRQPGVPHGHLPRVLHRGNGLQRGQPQLSGIGHFRGGLQLRLPAALGLQVRRPQRALSPTGAGRPLHGHGAEPKPGTTSITGRLQAQRLFLC